MKAICKDNTGYEASLTKGKTYEITSDKFADENNLIKIVDNTDDVYYFSKECFTLIQ